MTPEKVHKKIPVTPKIPATLLLGFFCIIQISLLLGSFHASAHRGDRVIPIYEITDDMLEFIDLDDGSIDEWDELFEPTLTTLDFTRQILDRNTLNRETVAYDPADLDFRIWLGWNDTHNRLYVSGQFADEVHVRERKSFEELDCLYWHVDGDHSGGPYQFFSGERSQESLRHAQSYTAPFEYEPELSVGLRYNSFGEPYEFDWAGYPPYAQGGDGAAGEFPIVWVVEFFITPFDYLDDDPEGSVISELEGGKVIGIFLAVGDGDLDSSEGDGHRIYDSSKGGGNPHETADAFVDGALLHADGQFESVVLPSSWGLIKASLIY